MGRLTVDAGGLRLALILSHQVGHRKQVGIKRVRGALALLLRGRARLAAVQRGRQEDGDGHLGKGSVHGQLRRQRKVVFPK